MSSSDRYTRTAVLLHWLIAVMVVTQFAWGWWMQTVPKQPVGPRVDAYNLHKSAGLTILALTVLRLLWRVAHRPPALPPMPAWQRRAAIANHVLLYAIVIAQPVIGYLGSAFSGYPVRYFGWVLPAWSARHDAAKDLMSVVHLSLACVLAVAVTVHVLAVVRHTVHGGWAMLGRMGWRRRPGELPRRRASLEA